MKSLNKSFTKKNGMKIDKNLAAKNAVTFKSEEEG